MIPGVDGNPRLAVSEAVQAEELGLASVWIAEKYDAKDLPSLAGALAMATSTIAMGAAVTHTGLRHPLTIASMGQTLQALSRGRFRLGFGRGAPRKWVDAGVSAPTLRSLEDTADILRRLWAGETVSYHGPAGRFPSMRIRVLPDVPPPPLYLAAIGPKTLSLAGRCFDGVILHPFLTPDAVAQSVAIMREARDSAGRSQETFNVFAAVVAPSEIELAAQIRSASSRASRYCMTSTVRTPLLAANGWNPNLVQYERRPTDPGGTTKRPQLPLKWLRSASALGNEVEQVHRLKEYLAAGANEIILHGATAHQLGKVVHRFNGGEQTCQ
ncbi:MAG TPA: TIGR03857 family LLM class F420-dependent oxidoreductase [Acidimicrobiales bacterium]